MFLQRYQVRSLVPAHFRRRSEHLKYEITWRSESAPQPDVYLYRGFAGDCGNRETDTSQKAVQSYLRNFKYNICAERDERIAQCRAQNNAAAPLTALSAGDAFADSVNHTLQPGMIDVGDESSDKETRRRHPAKPHQTGRDSDCSENEDESTYPAKCGTVEPFCRCVRGFSIAGGHNVRSTVAQDPAD